MIYDLVGATTHQRSVDVLVIGAGTVGLVIATRLAASGLSVACLESGSREQTSDTHPFNAVEQVGTAYAGAEHGRFRCLGGSSTRWGGALIPFQAVDMNSAVWPLCWLDLAPFLSEVESLFGLPSGSYDDRTILREGSHVARLAKWPPFGRRNVYSLLRGQVEALNGPEVWINATATRFMVEGDRLVEVEASAPDGARICFRAAQTVIAAGAIESTRILHLIDRQSGGLISRRSPTLGAGFQDHISAVVATLEVSNQRDLNRLVGFRFDSGGGMRNMRFELAPDSTLRQQVPIGFAHVGFSESRGGFWALREFVRAIQRRRLPKLDAFIGLAVGLPWLVRALWWRFVHKRLLYPNDSTLELHMVIEQENGLHHKIDLSETMTDCFNLPLARINWHISAADVESMVRATDAILASWDNSALASLAKPHRRDTSEVTADMRNGGGIYHPTGSTRMAYRSEDGVVDSHLRVFALPNVSVCATSVLPTGGGANPTMMLMLLAIRCAVRLGRRDKAGTNL